MKKNLDKILTLIIGMSLLGSCSLSNAKERKFWIWFTNNSENLFHFEKNQDQIFDDLSSELKKVHPDLVFEFGPVIDNKRDFVISADGIRAAFPAVELLYENKPKLNDWNIIKFRPRRKSIFTIELNGKKITPEDLKFALLNEDDSTKSGIILFIKGFNKIEEENYTHIAYLFLDQIIGEFDVETHVGSILVQGFESSQFSKSKPIYDLAKDFDLKIYKTNANLK
jgi:hypothetical protein